MWLTFKSRPGGDIKAFSFSPLVFPGISVLLLNNNLKIYFFYFSWGLPHKVTSSAVVLFRIIKKLLKGINNITWVKCLTFLNNYEFEVFVNKTIFSHSSTYNYWFHIVWCMLDEAVIPVCVVWCSKTNMFVFLYSYRFLKQKMRDSWLYSLPVLHFNTLESFYTSHCILFYHSMIQLIFFYYRLSYFS